MRTTREAAMSIQRTHVIFNPVSAAGTTGRRREEILDAVRRHIDADFSLFVTNGPHEATGSAREAARRGTDLLIAVGGDGTIQEVVNGLFAGRGPLNPRCELGLISAGTGHGLAQSLGWPLSLEDQCAAIGRRIVRRIDIGRAVFADGDGRTTERYFVNECQAGIGGEVVKKVQTGHKRFGGLLAFGLVTLRTALRYPNRTITYAVDDGPPVTGPFLGIVAANGHVMAGGMKLAPRAMVADGRLDILLMHGQTLFERLRNFPKIYSGSHLASPKFGYLSGRSLTLASDEDVSFEADGELFGRLPCRIEILPGALKLRTDRPAKG
jgi:YegS/Rv2252/BmrU family lipid kinase